VYTHDEVSSPTDRARSSGIDNGRSFVSADNLKLRFGILGVENALRQELFFLS
jgi:hypothetical protein